MEVLRTSYFSFFSLLLKKYLCETDTGIAAHNYGPVFSDIRDWFALFK